MKQRNIGRYHIKQEIDHGGMSVVYLAHDPRFRRDVAIKVLSRNLQGQANIRARFEREARIIASLDHPAIVTVYDFGEDDGQPFLVMRLMPGGSLSDLLTFGRLNLTDTARIAERIGSALDVAHSRGLVHRDLKPANILFDANGDAFLTDFGIVKLFENDNSQINMTGSVVLGTPAYMSPEQALGKTIDKRSDVYALGAVIYEMLTGVPPYKGPTSVSVAMKHVMDPVPHVTEFRPDIAPVLDQIVAKAMSKEAADRYDSAGELARVFSDTVRSLPAQDQSGSIASAVSRKPITEAQARLKNLSTAGDDHEADSAPADSVYAGTADTQMQRNRRTLLWLGVAAGVLAFVGIALALIASLLSNGNGSPSGPPITPTIAIPLPVTATNGNSEVVVTPVPGDTQAPAPTVTTAPSTTPQPIMQINAGGGRVRGGPGTNYPILAQLQAATQLRAVATYRGLDGFLWFEVALSNGSRGWVREDVVTLSNLAAFDLLPTSQNIPPTPIPTATNTATASATPTLPPTPSPTPTRTPTVASGTATPIPLPSPTPTTPATLTPAPSSTSVDTATPVTPPTPTETPMPSPTVTDTPAP